MTRLISLVGFGSLTLMSVHAVTAGLLLPATAPSGGGGWLLKVASAALIALVAGVLAGRIDSRGWRRSLVLFAIVWGVHANNLIEAAVFSLDIPRAVLPLLFLDNFLATLALVVVVDRLASPPAPRRRAWPEGLSACSWIARIAACDLTYVVLYLAAGVLVWPFVKDFYAAREVPALGGVLLMQVVRGLILTSLLLLTVARLRGPRATIVLLAGVTLSILGGIAPLMVPNPYLPGVVRLPHLVEVGVSNFVFGCIAASVLTRPRRNSPGIGPSGS